MQEYEAEMRSYQIAVKEFFIEDPPDYGDVLVPTPVPILTKKVNCAALSHDSLIHLHDSENQEGEGAVQAV